MKFIENYTEDSNKHKNDAYSNEVLDFMTGSAMIFSGFAITANDMKKKIAELQQKLHTFEEENIIEWSTLSIVANKVGLSKSAVNKRLHNGDFEEDVDFKRDGNKIVVHQGAIGRLQRQRRSNNG